MICTLLLHESGTLLQKFNPRYFMLPWYKTVISGSGLYLWKNMVWSNLVFTQIFYASLVQKRK